MKLILSYTSPFPRKAGHTAADRRVCGYVKGLNFAGIPTTLVVTNTHTELIDRSKAEDFEIVYFGANHFCSNSVAERCMYWVKLVRMALKDRYTGVLFYNTRIDSALAALILKLMGVKVYYEMCDHHSDFSKGFTVAGLLSRINEVVFAYLSDQVLVISRYLKLHIKKINSKAQIIIVPIMVDTDEFCGGEQRSAMRSKYQISNDSIVISYIGGMWKHQGVANLIGAFIEVFKSHKNIKLIIAGNYVKSDNHDDILSLIEDSLVAEYVILPGWVNTTEVNLLMGGSDILVLPQLEEDFTHAGLPTKLAEYCSAGKAILATNVGDIVCYFQHKENAYICEPNSVEELKNGLTYLINERLERDSLGYKAKELANQKFSHKGVGIRIANAMRRDIA